MATCGGSPGALGGVLVTGAGPGVERAGEASPAEIGPVDSEAHPGEWAGDAVAEAAGEADLAEEGAKSAGDAAARRLEMPIGACTGAVKSSKKSRSAAELVVISANGNECSSNTTCLEIITLLVTGSRHRYPL